MRSRDAADPSLAAEEVFDAMFSCRRLSCRRRHAVATMPMMPPPPIFAAALPCCRHSSFERGAFSPRHAAPRRHATRAPPRCRADLPSPSFHAILPRRSPFSPQAVSAAGRSKTQRLRDAAAHAADAFADLMLSAAATPAADAAPRCRAAAHRCHAMPPPSLARRYFRLMRDAASAFCAAARYLLPAKHAGSARQRRSDPNALFGVIAAP